MSEYSKAKTKPLFFKGVNKSEKEKRHEKKIKEKKVKEVQLIGNDLIEESKKNGGWWIIDCYENISSGKVCFQTDENSYLCCLENGDISISEPHDIEEIGPRKEEIFTLYKIPGYRYGIKTCYDRFISATNKGYVFSRPEAISPQESIELVVQDGKVALQSPHGFFFTCKGGTLTATSLKAESKYEIFRMRTNRSYKEKKQLSETELFDPVTCEVNMVKRFQSFGNQKLVVTNEAKDSLYNANTQGKLCEEMLNRRSRVKSDKYCKSSLH